MRLKFVVTRVIKPDYVELNSFSGFHVPGRVNICTVERIPVDQLPGADLEQYGHQDAQGFSRLNIREARRLLGHDARAGEVFEAEARVNHRNRGMRKGGSFECHPTGNQGLRKTEGTPWFPNDTGDGDVASKIR